MSEAQNNDQTLDSYTQHVDEYIAGTPQAPSGEFLKWMNAALSCIPEGGTILELGSAFGRDSALMESRGYRVDRTDAAQGFVDYLQGNGLKARKLNALTDEFSGPYDMIFANAVLLHFTPKETEKVVRKAHSALTDSGVFAFSLKEGNDTAAWSNEKLDAPRYFHYWSRARILELLKATGFENIDYENVGGKDVNWHMITARK